MRDIGVFVITCRMSVISLDVRLEFNASSHSDVASPRYVPCRRYRLT